MVFIWAECSAGAKQKFEAAARSDSWSEGGRSSEMMLLHPSALSALCHVTVTLVPMYAHTFKAQLPVLQEAGSGSSSVEHMVSKLYELSKLSMFD